MADENTPAPKGVPEGVSAEDLNQGEISAGDGLPTQPVVNNAPPPKDEGKEEEFANPEKDKADEKKDEGKKADEAPADEEDEDAGVPDTEYPSYGDPSADAIVDIFKEAGVKPEQTEKLFLEAAETGDLSKVDVKALVELVGKTKADLIMLAANDYLTRTIGRVQEIEKAVLDTVGGDKQWQALAKWADKKKETDPQFAAQVDGYNQMLSLNPTSAALAAKALVEAYNADKNNKSLNTKIVQGTKSGGNISVEPLSRADYVTKLHEAYAKNDMEEVQRLNAQRAATKQLSK